eukprot:g6025.t2
MTKKAPQVVPEGTCAVVRRREEHETESDWTTGGSKRSAAGAGAGAGGEGRHVVGSQMTKRRKPSQQSYRIKSRRELKHNSGPIWAAKTMKNSVKRVALAYTTSRACMLFLAMATLSSCLFYILATYLQDRVWVRHAETAYGILFLVDYCLTAIAAPVPLTYALSRGGLTDLVSCLPAFGSFQTWMASLAFVRYLRVGKAIRVMRNHKLLTKVFSDDEVTIKATLLIVKVVGVVMMTSAIIFGVERGLKDDDKGTGAFDEPGWQWHDAFYFTIVTLSTVGYGDILPISVVSRLLIVVVIIFALTYIPLEIGKLVDAVNARPKNRKGFPRSLVGKQLHVVLALSGGVSGGSDGEFDCDMLERCVAEFFDEDQKASNVSVWVVIMAPSPPSEEISALCRQPKYRSRVVYFKGSVTNPRDMAAVCAEYADCIFLFPSSAEGGDPRAVEETTHLAAKSVRRYIDRTPTENVLMEKVKFLSQTGNPRRTVVTVGAIHSKHQLLGFGIDHVICLDELKLSMLAVSTLCPAFLPFVANCVRSCENSRGSSVAKPKSQPKDGGIDECEEPNDWLDDYAMGTNYEIYSVPLEVISGESTLWGMSFSSAARIMYDDSGGTVLLLAAVDHREPTSSAAAALNHQHMLQRTLSAPGPPSLRGPPTSASSGRGCKVGAGGGQKKNKKVADEAYARVEVFPDDDYRFTIESHLLVMAETQAAAEDLIFSFQNSEEEGDRGRSPPLTAALAAASTSCGARAPYASDIAPGAGGGSSSVPRGDGLGVFFASNASSASAIATRTSAFAAGASSGTSSATAAASAAAAGTASAVATTTASSSSSPRSSNRPPDVLVGGGGSASGGDVAGVEGPGAPGVAGVAGVGGGGGSGDGQRKKPPSRALLSRESLSELALGGFSPATSVALSTGSKMRTPGSLFREELDDEAKEELNTLQKQAFHGDEVDWTHALDALKRARVQLDELDLDQESPQNPAEFFDKVGGVSSSVTDALRMHTTSLPVGLKGHIVLVGGNACLQYYILALRRQRPLRPIVVVTEDTESFFELRDRLVECKFLDLSLDISQIYHVFGRTQDRFTLEEANVAQAESVMLMSDQPDDTAVLLGSFELEQVLEDIPPEEPRPKVLIDLAKDDSIYYCGITLGGTNDDGSALESTRSVDQQNLGHNGGGEDVRYWPLFASGRVWTTSIMDVFAVRTYFNAHVLAFFETLLQIHTRHLPADHGDNKGDDGTRHQKQQRGKPASILPQEADIGGENGRNPDGKGNGQEATEDDNVKKGKKGIKGRSQFAHLHIDASFAGRTYGDLTRHLIARGAMPLGLYRPSGTKDNTLGYAHINPSPEEPLQTWPPGSTRRRANSAFEDGDNDDGPEEKQEDAAGSGSGKGERERRWRMASGMLRTGDDVFVLRSRGCLLSGTPGQE